MVDWSGVIGLQEADLTARFGPPSARRLVGRDLWLTFEGEASYRVVCRPGGPGEPARAAAWTAAFRQGHATLADAAAEVGLWPLAAPDVAARDVGAPLARRAIPSTCGERTWSLTATVRDGRFSHLSVFDEAPDWL